MEKYLDQINVFALWKDPVDFRKGRDFFWSTVMNFMDLDPDDDKIACFFINKRRNQLRIFHHDAFSTWLVSVKPDSGTCSWEFYCPDEVSFPDQSQVHSLISFSDRGSSFESFKDKPVIMAWREPVDFRKGRNYFQSLVKGDMEMEELQSSLLCLFSNRRHNQMRLFHYDGNSTWLISLYADKGTYKWQLHCPDEITPVSTEELKELLEGR